jgi:acetoin utilization deacetylase AcuC-like enzyme
LTIPVVWSDAYDVDIGLHVFPTRKYRLVCEDLERRRPGLPPFDVVAPTPASWDDLALVHTSEYLQKIRAGTLTRDDVAQLELPWSRAMVEGFRLMTGGTILAARLAAGVGFAGNGVAVHIGGGLHHAFPNHGEGFCPFNDVAIAIRALQRDGIARHAIIDLDVHHGNGNAFVFGPDSSPDDDRVFTFSMHQQYNYPMWKPQGSFDIGLSDGVSDATYLRELAAALPQVLAHRPNCVFYLAGADPYEDDQLGGLRLTLEGLHARDRLVIRAVRGAGIPLVVTLAGGYARRVEDTVAIHVATIEEALGAASSDD